MVMPTSSKAGAAARRSEFGSAQRRAAKRGTRTARRPPAPIDAALVAADHHDEIKITREGFRATPRDDRAG